MLVTSTTLVVLSYYKACSTCICPVPITMVNQPNADPAFLLSHSTFTIPAETFNESSFRQACCKERNKRNDNNLQFHHPNFLPVPSTFINTGHLNPVSNPVSWHWQSQGSFHKNRNCTSVSQSHSICNFLQAQSSTPFHFLLGLFLTLWLVGDCCFCHSCQGIGQNTHHPRQCLPTTICYHGSCKLMPVSIPRPTS